MIGVQTARGRIIDFEEWVVPHFKAYVGRQTIRSLMLINADI
jgi:hypothetical protein